MVCWKGDGEMTDDPNDKMKKTIKSFNPNGTPRPHFGGLLTDPIPRRVRELEERVEKLEAIIKQIEAQNGVCYDKPIYTGIAGVDR